MSTRANYGVTLCGCPERVYVRGLCKRCYDQWRRSLPMEKSRMFKWYSGISHMERDQRAQAQGNLCAICLEPFSGMRGSQVHTDHNHATGAIRGVLCRKCNVGLGSFGDSVTRLQSAQRYLVSMGGQS